MNAVAPDPRRWKALILICTAIFVVVLDIAIVNVALPSIGADLHFAERNLQWVITAYGLTYGGFLLLGGRASDLIGRRIMFMIGLALFGAASLVCGLSTSSGMLIVARGVQGFGAAIVTPAALSIISVDLHRGQRAQQGARRLGRGRRQRRRGGRPDGRRPDEVPGLGVDLLGQRAGRARSS